MNTKNNRRRRESVKKIEKSFIELLQKKEINEISVKEICKKCEINRSTFYANFIDIYDLADKLREHLEKDVEKLYQGETEEKYNSNDYLRLFYHIYDNRQLYRTYFKLGYDDKHKVTVYDSNQAEEFFDNKNIGYHIEFFKSGLNAIIKKWLDGDCAEFPEEMNEIIKREYQGRVK